MKRSAFKVRRPPGSRPPRAAKQIGPEYNLRPRAVAVAVAGPARAVVAVPKDEPLQHRAYMAAVRTLPCDLCRTNAGSQFCHADILGKGGKGAGIKSDCRLGWPGCPDCHFYVGTSGSMPKKTRHHYEAAAGRRTRAAIRRMGLWPATLPEWAPDKGTHEQPHTMARQHRAE